MAGPLPPGLSPSSAEQENEEDKLAHAHQQQQQSEPTHIGQARAYHLDKELIASIDAQLEDGIGSDPRGAGLRAFVDALRESTLTPRAELLADTVCACDKLSDAIEGVVAGLG
jgi:hypothetical protein